MNFSIAKPLIFFLVFICLAGTTFSQPIRLYASADKRNILLGEPLVLTLKAEGPRETNLGFFKIDTIPHFEILQVGKIDTFFNANVMALTQRLTITSFDSGSRVIPSFSLPRNPRLITPALKVEVSYTDPFDPKADYHGIKDILAEESVESTANSWLYLVGAALVLIAVLAYIFAREKQEKIPPPPVTDINAYEKAMQQLTALKQEHQPKIFFTQLVYIFRDYLHARKGIYSMQKTTDDLVLQLKERQLAVQDITALTQALRLSDFVKFAKYPATENEMNEALEVVRRNIDTIEKTGDTA